MNQLSQNGQEVINKEPKLSFFRFFMISICTAYVTSQGIELFNMVTGVDLPKIYSLTLLNISLPIYGYWKVRSIEEKLIGNLNRYLLIPTLALCGVYIGDYLNYNFITKLIV